MKIAFSLLIVIHGLVHFLGFAKAFQLAQIKELSAVISRPAGIFWLMAGLLLIAAGILFWQKINFWWIAGITGLVISQVLIVSFWADAKWGTVPNIVLLITIITAVSAQLFDRKIDNERALLYNRSEAQNAEIVQQENLNELPEPVQKWLKKAGVIGKKKISTVWLKQHARMKLKPEQTKWLDATAEQFFTVNPPGFIWTVDLKMSPVIKIKGRDKFENGKGQMLIKMHSLFNVVNESGEKIDEGTLQRYLGEIVWFPSAALHPAIKWEELDENSARATLEVEGTKGSGTFYFDENSDLEKFTAMRFKGNEPEAERRVWIITVKETKNLNGFRIPVKMESTWMLEDGPWTWLDLEVTEIEYNGPGISRVGDLRTSSLPTELKAQAVQVP
jgi:hypothetical protein